jgi:hypothetical protein
MKNFNLLILVLLVSFLTGCDAQRGVNNIRRDFPNAEVSTIPGCWYEFIVRDTNGMVWYVVSGGANHLHNDTILFYSDKTK